uniref:Cysteine-rich putative secretory protein n=1 Tax=Argas monolakensis TaxID=34602 RepID=Q09JQ5_ARGMO|nr:cysteine-rich putative secretory protein [Argas monolakensis]
MQILPVVVSVLIAISVVSAGSQIEFNCTALSKRRADSSASESQCATLSGRCKVTCEIGAPEIGGGGPEILIYIKEGHPCGNGERCKEGMCGSG